MEKIIHLYTHRERFFWSQRKEEVGWGGGVLVGEQLAPNIQDVVVLQIRVGRCVCVCPLCLCGRRKGGGGRREGGRQERRCILLPHDT